MSQNKKEKKFISLVVYLHNAEDYITYFLENIIPTAEKHFEKFEVICVDDGCTDQTMERFHEHFEAKRTDAVVSIIHMSFFQGLESAMNAGRDMAIGDFVYEFDDVCVDYEPETLLRVYEKLLEGYDIVACSSNGKTRISSRIFYWLYNATSRGKGKIGPETFRIISRRAINRIKSMGQYIPYRKAVYGNCGLKMTTMGYESKNVLVRVKNKTVTAERASLALDSFIYFTNVLERISAIICGVFLLITVGMGIYLVADFFNQNKPVEGWLSTMGFLALGFFGVFALLTIILKYMSVMLNLIFKQQRYLIAEVEKVAKE